MRRLAYGFVAAAFVIATPLAQRSSDNPREILDRAIADFLAGHLAESVTGFDRVATLVPQVAPQLWQRGIALYYAGRYQDCRAQFESHRLVNPNDVENPAWHYLCVAKAESPAKARAALLPVGPDQRSPMREIYEIFRGTITPDAILKVGGADSSARFFAELYVGLYYDAAGDRTRAIEHLRRAADPRYEADGGYMHRVAQLHPLLRRADEARSEFTARQANGLRAKQPTIAGPGTQLRCEIASSLRRAAKESMPTTSSLRTRPSASARGMMLRNDSATHS
jgi:tetratricopeptide (TPR) repeat protein